MPPTPRNAVVSTQFREDLAWWIANDRKTALRLLKLMKTVLAEPFVGIGKPEALRFALAGLWSRRLTHEHRLVYCVKEDHIELLQARYHYE